MITTTSNCRTRRKCGRPIKFCGPKKRGHNYCWPTSLHILSSSSGLPGTSRTHRHLAHRLHLAGVSTLCHWKYWQSFHFTDSFPDLRWRFAYLSSASLIDFKHPVAARANTVMESRSARLSIPEYHPHLNESSPIMSYERRLAIWCQTRWRLSPSFCRQNILFL